MVESCCFVGILVSFLSFNFELGRFHFVRHFSEIIFVKMPLSFTFVNSVIFLLLLVGAFELALDFSHAH